MFKSKKLLLLIKSNRQKQRFCHPKMADLKAWSHGVRKANCCDSTVLFLFLLTDVKKWINVKKCYIGDSSHISVCNLIASLKNVLLFCINRKGAHGSMNKVTVSSILNCLSTSILFIHVTMVLLYFYHMLFVYCVVAFVLSISMCRLCTFTMQHCVNRINDITQ